MNKITMIAFILSKQTDFRIELQNIFSFDFISTDILACSCSTAPSSRLMLFFVNFLLFLSSSVQKFNHTEILLNHYIISVSKRANWFIEWIILDNFITDSMTANGNLNVLLQEYCKFIWIKECAPRRRNWKMGITANLKVIGSHSQTNYCTQKSVGL